MEFVYNIKLVDTHNVWGNWATEDYVPSGYISNQNASIDWEILRGGSGLRETKLINLCETTPLHQAVRFPTRFLESNRPSLLDLAFVQRPEEVSEIECLPPLGTSDHCVIHLALNTGGLKLPPPRWIKQYHRVDPASVELQAQALDWISREGDDAETFWTRGRQH